MPYQQGPTVWHNDFFTAILCSWQKWQEDTEISLLPSALKNACSFSLSFNKMVQFLPKVNIHWHIHHKHPKTIVYPWIHLVRMCSGKESACQSRGCKRHSFSSWDKKIPWSRKRQSTPVFSPGKFQGQRILWTTSMGLQSQTRLITEHTDRSYGFQQMYNDMYHPGDLPNLCCCYAQVAKSPNGHQGADIWCKSKRVFITKLELGLPPIPTQQL